jgi:tetratricopeptide (TPR) repeat protein
MKRSKIIGVTLGVLLALGLAGVWQLQKKIDAQRQALQEERDELVLRSPKLIKRMSLEYAPLVGAMYWTRAVQYYGEKHRLQQMRRGDLELLWPLLDITTTLDPNLIVAYRFGSTFLSDAPPRGAGDPDHAVELLRRGLQANPDYWRFYQDMGNVYYFDKKDYPRAAEAFAEGAKNPRAAIWMKVMAAKIAADGESLETSYFLWRDVYQTAKEPRIKKNAELHLRLVKVDLDLRELNRLADEYERRTGRRAKRMSELVQAGLLSQLPGDPDGYPYVLGEGGKAELNLNSPMLEEKLMNK